MKKTGHCLCGAVTFTAERIETGYHSCHCDICRRWGGGPAFAASVGNVEFNGQESLTRYQSSDWAERGFCKRCGTHLFYRLINEDHYVLWVGAFDDPADFRLQGEIFIEQKPTGYALAGEHPRLTGAEFLASMQQTDS